MSEDSRCGRDHSIAYALSKVDITGTTDVDASGSSNLGVASTNHVCEITADEDVADVVS